MNVEEIRKTWTNQNRNIQSEVTMWNSQAKDPVYNIMPTFKDTKFLQLLQQENMINPAYDVLDVGCGVGVYAMALAQKLHSATGIDFSPEMIAHGKERLETEKIANVNLACMDWSTVDLEQQGFKERFDLVFAHTSPAICDAATFEKMNDASKRFCVISNPSRMIEPVLREVHNLVGLTGDRGNCGDNRVYILDMLFHMGYLPKLAYEHQVWPMNQSYEDACSYYLGRTMMAKQLSPQEINKVKEYLANITKDGKVVDQINTTITTIYWEKITS
ncbi:MAG: class I SAM-dependent methyltransferase [Candidatus Bathyarchaeota archaeon]|nr:class I SAM-dependent methyltransferase [Candidatus Bathyarchaeota archaeon]